MENLAVLHRTGSDAETRDVEEEAMTPAAQAQSLRRLRFPDGLEFTFHAWHYATVRGTLRVVVAPVIAFVLFDAVRDYLFGKAPLHSIGVNGFVISLCLILFGLTYRKGFEKVWQPVTVSLIWLAMTIMLNGPAVTGGHKAPDRGTSLNRPASLGPLADRSAPLVSAASAPAPPNRPEGGRNDQMLSLQLYTIMILLAAFRLRFVWAMLLNSGLLGSAFWVLVTQLHVSTETLTRFGERSLLVVFGLMISALVQERLSRATFLANYLLDQERNQERRQREQTEGMLHILGQAIGGIVHDLGNPLHAVQGGALLLEQIIDEGDYDTATLKELAEIIGEGTQLLNYQRLTLMEQTRILEGRPIPVERRVASLRRMIAAGIRYQKPRFAFGREVVVEGPDLELCLDEMKMTSVFMNLIGNAMKYSQGEIRVCWRNQGGKTLIAVLDQGSAGRGLSEAHAGELFAAFGRLEAHASIEGTGLGLLSVRRIVEAHGGEVYVEGHTDGTPESPLFTTAQRIYPSLLTENFRTAFVLVCPC